MFIGIFTLKGKNDIFWFSHFNLSNFTLGLFHLFIFISFTIYVILKITAGKANLIKSNDYIFSIINLVLIFPYLFFINTVFTFLFLLELISVVLFYKLISSKI